MPTINSPWWRSCVRSFFDWWGSELAGLVPPRLQQIAQGGPRLETLWLGADAGSGLAAAPVPDGPCLDGLRSKRFDDPQALRRLAIPEDQALVREHRIAATAREHIRAMLQTELDHALPFAQSEIAWGFAVERPEGDQLVVRQVILKQRRVDELRATAQALQLPIHAVGVWWGQPCEDATITVATFLDPEPRWAVQLRRVNRGLAVMLAAILLLGLALPQLDRLNEIEALTTLASQLRAQAVRETRRLNEARAAQDKASALLRRRQATAPLTLTLLALTAALPDQAWLSELQLNRSGEVTIAGHINQGAASLLQILAGDPRLQSARFTAPVTIDAAQRRERFQISFRPAAPG